MKPLLLLAVLAVGLAAPGLAKADVATDWNRTMVSGLEAAQVGPQPSSRIGAIVQVSVFDAVNGIERRYSPYHVSSDAPRGASRTAAAANAAYTALVALIPSQQALFDQQLQATLAGITDDPAHPGQSVLRGLDWGRTVADAILDVACERRLHGCPAAVRRWDGSRRLAADAAALRATTVPSVRDDDALGDDLAVTVPARWPAVIDERTLGAGPR